MERRSTRTRTRWGLKGRLVSLTLVVGTVPLVLGIGTAYVLGKRELHTAIGSSFAGLATESARRLDLAFGDEIARMTRLTRDRMIVRALAERASDSVGFPDDAQRWGRRDGPVVARIIEGPVAERLRRYVDAEGSEPSVTKALFVTDADGRLVASVNAVPSYAHGQESWWRRVTTGQGRVHVGQVSFDRTLNAYAFDVSIPIFDESHDRVIGVAHRVFDAASYFAPLVSPIRFGKTGHVMVIDNRGTVVSCPVLPTGTSLADAELVAMVTPPYGGWVKTSSDGHGSDTPSIVGFSPVSETNRLTAASSGLGWYTFAWQSSDELFAPTRRLLGWMTGIGLVAIGLLATLGYMAAVRIVTPVRHLQRSAALIGRNELAEPIVVRTGDEIEGLAEEINRMNHRLQQAFSGLTEEVRSLHAYNEQILNSVPNPIMMLEDERVQYVNRAARLAFGLADRPARGLALFEIFPLDELSRERLRTELRAYARGRPSSGGDDSSPVSIVSPNDPLGPRSTTGDKLMDKELTAHQTTYRYEIFRVDTPGNGRGWTGLVLWDTTLDSQLQDQLRQAEKLAGLGVLTSGIGHELNNPLFGIMSLSESIRDERDPTRIRDYAGEIASSAKRMARIIRDFAGASQIDRTELRDDVSVNEQLDLALRVVGLTHEVAGLQVRRHYQPVPTIRAVPEEIGQVFVSLITNAIQAMKGKGAVDLCTEPSANAVTIKIRDQGPGIPKAYASKIFDPFFTTKAPGQGTGLGLTLSRRIVLRHGGQIRLDNPGGSGAVFILTFPVLHREAEDSETQTTHIHLSPSASTSSPSGSRL